MAASTASTARPVALIWGEDEFTVKQRARQLYQDWCGNLGGMDHEIIDAAVSNSGEALRALARLREALQTLPFFGGAKVVWLQNCSFLGDDRTAASSAVTNALAELADELKAFRWEGVRLLISAGKVDRRKTFYKTLEKLGVVEACAALSADDRDWAMQAEDFVRRELQALGKQASSEALALVVSQVGPNLRQLQTETEKLALYVGAESRVEPAHVEAVVTRNKQARAFALADALGDRNLPRLLRCLDNELWEMRVDRQRSEIGLLYGLVSKVRVLILLKEMLREGWVRPEPDFTRFRAQLSRIPADQLPEDKRFNPLSLNPYILFKALPQARNYTTEELVRAMELLLQANKALVTSSQDEAMVLQRVLVEIVKRPASSTTRPPAQTPV